MEIEFHDIFILALGIACLICLIISLYFIIRRKR